MKLIIQLVGDDEYSSIYCMGCGLEFLVQTIHSPERELVPDEMEIRELGRRLIAHSMDCPALT